MNLRRFYLVAPLIGFSCLPLGYSQENPARLTFEVISIKPFQPNPSQPGGGIQALPGGQTYQARGAPVILMIALMYKIPERQITGGPAWLRDDRWDVDAKADHPGYTLDELHAMYQSMLADQFKLKFHKETKEGPVYAMTIDKSGLKMKVNNTPQPFKIPINGGPGGTVVGTRVPMEYLCWWLGAQVLRQDGRPVINKTGLDGNYDFTLTFAPELPPDFPTDRLPPGFADRPNIFQALKDQLGVRLEPAKGPVEYFVIDSAEKPATPN
jgi:uncharacterized protein (TIGR03435 family)